MFDFPWWRRRKKADDASGSTPLEAWDQVIGEWEGQAAQVRRSAATLLTLKGQLERDLERYRDQEEAAEVKKARAEKEGDLQAARVLSNDLEEARRLFEVTREGLAQVKGDAALLIEAAEDLAGRLRELKRERQGAAARLRAGEVVTLALRQRMERFRQVLALDAARDEVERAHQLAQIYREDRERG